MEQEKTCCFTGYRPAKLGFTEDSPEGKVLKNRIRGEILRLIDEYNVRKFISGMALGVDTFAAEAVLEFRNAYPDITLECAIPCRSQTARWTDEEKERYEAILAIADKVTYVGEAYTAACMRLRNEYMVNNSDIVLAVWDGKPGGTASTVKFAKRNKKALITIPLKESEEIAREGI